MFSRNRPLLAATLAVVCVLLGLSNSSRAEEDEAAVVTTPFTAAEQARITAEQSSSYATVPLHPTGIVPSEFNGDVRDLPAALVPHYLHMWNDFPTPPRHVSPPATNAPQGDVPVEIAAPMPAPSHNFAGLGFNTVLTGGTAGAGWPPDTNGDVGPVYYIQAVNDAWGIFDKTNGTMVAGFTEDQLWSGAASGTPCDANNEGDPVAIHDSLLDRWVLTDFAFTFDNSGNPVAPFYQCFAVSKTNDPVAGGWYLYAVQMDTGTTGGPPAHTFVDYPKFGFWTDCLYMGANGFNNDTGNYAGSVFAAFDRTALFSGAALTASNSSIGYFSSGTSFGLFPANLSGTSAASRPPAGTAEYFVAESGTAYAFDVRKFHAGATSCGAGSTLSNITSVTQASYGIPANAANTTDNIVPQPGVTRKLDSLGDEIMQRVVYRKIGTKESLWVVHSTCGSGQSANSTCATDTTPLQPQWAQIDVTAGTIATTPVQQQIYNLGDGLYRWMGSINVDGSGDMAIGYSTSSSVSPHFPSIAYSGRLVTDTLNQLPQTEVQLSAGLGSQNTCGALCGGQPISRWGDYSAMTIDPADDCTFWYTNLYYSAATHTTNAEWDTRIGSFKFPSCTSIARFAVSAAVSGGNGTITPASQTISSGSAATFTVTPNSGHQVASVTGSSCTVTQLNGTTWITNAISSACTVTAKFTSPTFTVTASVSGGNGTITPASQTVAANAAATFTVTPTTGYHVATVTGDTCTVTQGSGNTWTSSAITSDCAVTATFAVTSFAVNATVSGGHGTIAPASQNVNSGSSGSLIVIPQPTYHVASVVGDTCTPALVSGTTWTTGAVTSACAVTATFAIDTFTVSSSVTGGHGTITPASQTVNSGSPASATVKPDTGYHVVSVVGDTCTVTQQGTTTTWTTGNIATNCAITATFAIDTFTVTAAVSGGNGSVTPPSQSVDSGSAATFTIVPNTGFQVQSATGDTCTVSLSSGTTWTSSPITADCAVTVTFAANALVFTTQPSDVVRGSTLGTIAVTEEDSSGNVIDNNATVDFTIAACGGSVDLGSVAMVHGVATLDSSQTFYTVAPGLQITATATGVSGMSQSFAVTASSDFLFADGFDGCRL